MMDAKVRLATPRDAEAISGIYGYYAKNTAVTFSESAPDADAERERIEEGLRVYPWLVAESGGGVVGYAYAAQIRPHDAYKWSVELTVYLSPDAPKGQGLGTMLLTKLLPILKAQGFVNAYSVVTGDNEASIGMHRALGFEVIARFPAMGYKIGKWREVVWLHKALSEPLPTPVSPVPFCDMDITL